MKQKNKFSNSFSALILFAFAIIWLIYLCAGNQMPEKTADGITLAVTILALVGYFILGISDFRDLPRWLLTLLIVAGNCLWPALVYNFVNLFVVEMTLYPIVQTIISISQGFAFIIMYMLITFRACNVTESFLFRLMFVVIGLFLIFSVVVGWIPGLAAKIPVPLIVL